MRKWS